MGSFDAVDGIMIFQCDGARKTGEARVVEITVDSRAAEVVAPTSFAQDDPTRGSRSGAKYCSASGNIITNRGEKKLLMTFETAPASVASSHQQEGSQAEDTGWFSTTRIHPSQGGTQECTSSQAGRRLRDDGSDDGSPH